MRALTSVYTARNTAVCSVGPQATLPCARMSATFFLPMTAARATPLGALLTSMSVAPHFLWMSNTGTPSVIPFGLGRVPMQAMFHHPAILATAVPGVDNQQQSGARD